MSRMSFKRVVPFISARALQNLTHLGVHDDPQNPLAIRADRYFAGLSFRWFQSHAIAPKTPLGVPYFKANFVTETAIS